MHITLTKDYSVRADTSLLGYQGETNSRKITFSGLVVEGCDLYKLQILYSDGKVYELPIQNEEVTITGSILREIGYVSCQLLGYSVVGEEYTIVFKSNIFELEIKDAIEGDVAPIPPYEESVSALEKVLAHVDNSKEYAERAEAAATRAENAEAAVSGVAEAATDAANKAKEYSSTAKGYAETAQTSSASASASASAASVSEEAAKAAELGAKNYSANAEKSASNAREYSEAASSYANAASAYKDSASGYAASAKSYNDLAQAASTDAQQAEINAESHATAAENSANAAKLSETAVADAKASVDESKNIIEELSTEVADNTTKTLAARDEAVAARDTCVDIKETLTGYESPLFIKPTVKGQSIVVEDSAAEPIYELDVYGKSTQTQYNGYQLLEPSYFPETVSHDGVTWTNNGDGSFTVKGKSTAGAVNIHGEKMHLASGTYIANSLGVAGLQNVASVYRSGASVVYYGGGKPFTIDDTVDYIVFNVQATTAFSGTETKVYPMLEAGSTIHSYEPYVGGVPSPNPDYPQSIVSVDNPTITTDNDGYIVHTLRSSPVTKLKLDKGQTYTIKMESDRRNVINGVITDEADLTFTEGNKIYIYAVQTLGLDISAPEVVTGVVRTKQNFYTPWKFKVAVDGLYLYLGTNSQAKELDDFWIFTGDNKTKTELIKGSATIPYTLRGIPIPSGGNYTDSTGRQWVCDTLTVKNDGSGELIQRVWSASVDLKKQTYTSTPGYRYLASLPKPARDSVTRCLSPDASFSSTVGAPNSSAEGIRISPNTNQVVAYYASWTDDNITLPIEYILATPVTTVLSQEEVKSILSLNMYYPVTKVYNDKGAEMGITYIADTKNYIDNKFSELSAAIVSSASEEE